MKLNRRQFEIATLAALARPSLSLAQEPAAAREVPWLAEVQTPPGQLPADAPKLASPLVDFRGKRLAVQAEWLEYRKQLREFWQQLLGLWPAPPRPPIAEVIESDRVGQVRRQLVRYQVEPSEYTEAYLLQPVEIKDRLPGVVVMHATTEQTIRQPAGLTPRAEAAWGLRLAERGMVVICPRCFLWDGGEVVDYRRQVERLKRKHSQARGIAKMLFDARRGVDLLSSLDEVDPQRIGAAGHSLGAKEALYLAAFDDRIRATVSSEGGIGTAFSNWDAPWYLGTKQFDREHHELLALVAPRAFLLIGGDSADGARSWPFIEAALDAYRLWQPPYRVGLFNHGQGHTIPPVAEARTYEWLQTYL